MAGRLRLRCARSLTQVYCTGTERVAALARAVVARPSRGLLRRSEANRSHAPKSAKRTQRSVPCQGRRPAILTAQQP
ncbi:hypothetical protein CBM2592_B70037 [Cupriavidus taiwanensis]|nr:hypothetical protein CBM2588_B50037 [Cupriavidus taiwanensis]SOY72534.1 hypothetical protein CBM2592_B70037 [Cupriavidus taiwanensis]SOY96253.1 hypothetical protein CBM2591_B40072 [Cupriavidus taiwanensis]SOZ75355.1 hypothetical protein CBM2617_B90037 [Cupriavidus taiwanensis]SOZ89187.1 hypothetical protein CBM2618_B80037 [Cupriavidus taiwanensis]